MRRFARPFALVLGVVAVVWLVAREDRELDRDLPSAYAYRLPLRGGGSPRQAITFYEERVRRVPQSALNRTGLQPPAGLYTLLHRLGQRGALPFSAGDRLAMWAFLLLTTPIAIALSVIASWLRTGATVHISAIRRTGSV